MRAAVGLRRILLLGPLMLLLGVPAGYYLTRNVEVGSGKGAERKGGNLDRTRDSGPGSETPPIDPPKPSLARRFGDPKAPTESEPSLQGLSRFRGALSAYRATRVASEERDRATQEALAQEFCVRANDAIRALRPGILKHPEAFLVFLKEPETEPFLDFFLGDFFLAREFFSTRGEVAYYARSVPAFDEFPRELMRGLAELLKSGTSDQKLAILSFHKGLRLLPEEYQSVYRSLAQDQSSPRLQAASLALLSEEALREVFPTLAVLTEASTDSDVLASCYSALARTPLRESEELLIRRLASNPVPRTNGALARALRDRVRDAFPPLQHEYALALTAAIRQSNDAPGFQALLATTLNLPLDKAVIVLRVAAIQAPDPSWAEKVSRIVQAIGEGETDSRALVRILNSQ